MAGVRPKNYRPRIVDAQIERYLGLFGAIEVSGTKWCGKTWSSLAHARSVTYVDRGPNLAITQADPSYPLAGEAPHVIDEWQRVPAVWDTVRHAVDELGGARGQWILTGSSTPRKDEVAHSGAGRIGRIRMHPMTLQESGDSTASVSLSGLFEGSFSPVSCPSDIVSLAAVCARGGWPEHVADGPDDSLVVTREYLSAVFEQSIPALGGDADIARRLSTSLARNLGQAATGPVLAADVFAHAKPSEASPAELNEVSRYLGMLSKVYLIDEVPGWVPASRSPKRMRVKPKRYFADPSMAVALLGLSSEALLRDWQTFGLVFENLCMRDLDVYARALLDATAHPIRYYRDDSDLEADAVIERADGSWGAFEIKMSMEKVDAAAKSLLRIREKLVAKPGSRTKEPAFLAVLVGVGEAAYRRPDGVYVVPIRALGA